MTKSAMARVLSALLVASLLVSSLVFVGCDTSEETQSSETQSESEAADETKPEVNKTNYNEKLYLSIMQDSNSFDKFWVKKSEGDAMSEAVFSRQQKVKNWIGVDIIGSKTAEHNQYASDFQTAVKNKDGSVDTLISHVHAGVPSLVADGYLQDFNNIEGIDLQADHWNEEFMESLSISGHNYLGFSDFNILYTYVITFNKDMLEALSLPGYSVSDLYSYARDYKWTLDKFIELSEKGFRDNGENDIYGLTGKQWVPWIGFLHASNIKLVDIDERGKYALSIMNDQNKERTSDLVDKMKEFSKAHYTQLTFPVDGSSLPTPSATMTNNKTLMELTSTNVLEDYLAYDVTFGVLPYPMYDEAQGKTVGYRSLQWGGYICIPAYLRNTSMVADTLELLAFYSDEVQITFYEKILGKQVAEVPDDKQMLDIIWDSVCADFGQTYTNKIGGILYLFPTVTWPSDGGAELVSYYKGMEKSASLAIRNFISDVEKKAAGN